MSKFKVTQAVFMIASNRIVQPVVVKDFIGSSYLVRFEMAGEMWVDEQKLFAKREDAEAYLKKFKRERRGVRKYRDKLH